MHIPYNSFWASFYRFICNN